MFFRTSRSQFWKPCWTNIATSQKCFALNPKNFRLMSENDKNTIFFVQKEHGSPKSVPLDTSKVVLTVIKEHLARWPKNFAPCLKKIKKKQKVFKTAFSSSKQFKGQVESSCGTHAQKFFPEGRNLFPLSAKVTKRCQIFKKNQLSWKCLPGLVKCIFENHVKTYSIKSRRNFAQYPKRMKNFFS